MTRNEIVRKLKRVSDDLRIWSSIVDDRDKDQVELMKRNVDEVIEYFEKTTVPKKLPCRCGRVHLKEWYDPRNKATRYECPTCGLMSDWAFTKTEAIRKWNRRVEDESQG